MNPVIQAFSIITIVAIVFAMLLAHNAAKRKASLNVPIGVTPIPLQHNLEQELKKHLKGHSRKPTFLPKRSSVSFPRKSKKK